MSELDLEALRARDVELVELAKDVKILSRFAWPNALRKAFLAGWETGQPELPRPPEVACEDLLQRAPALERLADPLCDHPAARFLARTAQSYLDAIRLLEHAGRPEFVRISLDVYGGPRDPVLPSGQRSNLEAAEHFVAETRALGECYPVTDADYCLSSEAVAAQIQARVDEVFRDEPLPVVIDPKLSARAAAGAEQVRIRAGGCFSAADVNQLIEHEALVHTVTSRNGRRQPTLSCLGLGAPRTTATQEGLATFAELITTHIDLARLRRLALRIVAIHHALEGADFIEVFRYFHANGYPPEESYNSTQRIFRGGDVRGGTVFTKDAVYLRGLLQTHAWFHTVLDDHHVGYPARLFSGRLTWHDVEELAPCFDEGLIAPAAHLPPWIARGEQLAAYLAFSNLTHLLPLAETTLDDFRTVRLRRLNEA